VDRVARVSRLAERLDDCVDGFKVVASSLRTDLRARDEGCGLEAEPQNLDVGATGGRASSAPVSPGIRRAPGGQGRHRHGATLDLWVGIGGDDQPNPVRGQNLTI